MVIGVPLAKKFAPLTVGAPSSPAASAVAGSKVSIKHTAIKPAKSLRFIISPPYRFWQSLPVVRTFVLDHSVPLASINCKVFPMKILLSSLDSLHNKKKAPHLSTRRPHNFLLFPVSILRHTLPLAADAGQGHCALLWSHPLAFRISSAASAGLSTRPAERTFSSTTRAGVDITP